MADLLGVWRPRAFALAGRTEELSREDALRGRLELRLADVERRMRAADRGRRRRRGRAPARALHRARHDLRGPAGGRMALDERTDRARSAARSRARGCSLPGEPVLALVSGGADSTLLAHALNALGHPLETLHVAHALRGAESDGRRRGLPRAGRGRSACRTASSTGRSRPAPASRRARVRAGARLRMRCAPGRAVATGHTRDDRIETILYRLAASPGSAAFAALPAADGDGRVRPLLELGRDEVRAALRARRHRLARRRLERRSRPRAQPRAPRPPAGLPLAAPGGRRQPPAHGRAAGRGRGRARRDRGAAARGSGGLVDGGRRRRARRPSCGARCAASRAFRRRARSRPSASARSPARARARARCRSARVAWPSAATTASPSCGADAVPPPPQARSRSRCPGETAYGETRRALRAAAAATARSTPRSRPRSCCARPRPGERLPGARRTIARMLLEARVPRSERARYPVVAVHGEPVALPGIAVAAALRRPTGLVLTMTPC